MRPEPGGTVPPPTTEPVAQPVQETLLPIYLKDKDGNLQAVINWTIEELEELYQLKHQLRQPDQAPRYSIQWMSATGVAKADYAELTIQFRVLVRDEQWVRVPLRLDQAVLREGVQYQGSGQQFFHFEKDGEGYISWIRGEPGQQHQFTMKILVPVTTVGDESRLRLSMPRATSSDFKLQVPIPGAVAQASEGATLMPTASAANGGTEFTVLGLSGDFELSWRKANNRAAETPPVLEAVGAVLARIDSRSVNSEARLTVRGYGGPFDRFRVVLPEGAELTGGPPSGYSVVPVSSDAGETTDRREVEIRLPKKVPGPVEVRLSTRQTQPTSGPAGWFELAGFEVVGAVRQYGHIAVGTVGDSHLLWGPSRGVRQVEQLPEPIQHEDLVAGFEYFNQPCSLTARAVPMRTRISVEPEYLLLVDEDQVRLEATLKYTVRGAKVFALDVELPGWQFDEAGPDNLVAVDGVADQSGVLSIPLLQPSMGQIEVTIRAHQEIVAGTSSLQLALPRPRATSSGPAAVVVWPDNDVELTPDTEAMQGLVLQQVAPQMKLPEPRRQQVPLFYRGETANSLFAAEFAVHVQAVTVDVSSQVNLVGEKQQVEQKLAYKIDYEALDKLTIEVPRSLVGSETMEILLDGQRLPPTALSGPADEEDGSKPARLRIALRPARIGPCELVIRYPIEMEKLLPKSSIICTVPLVMPLDGALSGNKLYVTTKPGIKIQNREGPWNVLEEEAEWLQQRRGLQLVASERTGEVVLAVHLEDPDALGSTVVERAWVQTCLVGNLRQERAVFRFTSDQKSLELIVPAGVELDRVKTSLDRETVAAQVTAERTLLVPLPNNSNHRPHWLEVHYSLAGERPWRGQVSMELPHLGRDVWVRRMYWQVVLPPNEHVIVPPADFTPEFHWGWDEVFLEHIPVFWGHTPVFWGRIPALEQPQLETWAGGPHLTEVPASSSRYLFSALGPVRECELRTASRSFIVLGTSSVMLLAGLLLIYLPASRHPATLLAVALAFLSSAVLYPGATLLASQAAGLGLALALVAGLLQRVMAQPGRRGVLREPASSVLEKGSTQSQYRPPVAGNRASTETAPAAMPLSSPDSNS